MTFLCACQHDLALSFLSKAVKHASNTRNRHSNVVIGMSGVLVTSGTQGQVGNAHNSS